MNKVALNLQEAMDRRPQTGGRAHELHPAEYR